MSTATSQAPNLLPAADPELHLHNEQERKKIGRLRRYKTHISIFDPQNCPFDPRIKMLRSTFGARRSEQESFYIMTIACRVTERERNQICRRRRHSRKQQNYCRPKQRKNLKKFFFEKWSYF